MKQILLTGLLSITAAGMAFAGNITQAPAKESMKDRVVVKTVKNLKSENGKRLAPGVRVSTSNGVKKLHSINMDSPANISAVKKVQKRADSQTPDGYALYEGFEDWDGADLEWIPEGWTVDMRGDVPRSESWTPTIGGGYLPAPKDGNYYYGINYSSERQDEWLISPEIEVVGDMILSYWLYLDPVFLFSIDNVDWNEYEFIGDKVVAATLQIWAQPEGGEWQMLHDYVDDYKDMGLMDMMMISPAGLEEKSISLAQFAGQKVKVAFRYVGTDGNTMLIDAIGIGYPALEDISYMDPFFTLYWGFEKGWEMSYLSAAIGHYPVYEPLSWTNMSYVDGATFSWKYCDPITAEFVTDNDPDVLEVTYVPDYSSEALKKNNFFYPPVLTATAPYATPGSYSSPYAYFQAGGKAERTLNDGSEFLPSLIPFNFHDRGLAMVTVDDPQIGDPAIPVFGYNVNTNDYWLNYSLNGTEAIEGDYSRLEGISNIFFASGAPLVVNGMTLHAYGKVADDAEFTAIIYGLNEDMNSDFATFTEIARTSIKGSDIIAESPTSRGYLALSFDFESPVVVQATAEHPAYVFMITGFNSDKVDYFVPLQSNLPDPNYMCQGYILNHIDLSNHIDRPAYYSFKPMVYKEGDEYVDLYGAFAIGIDAEYPWLTTECEQISLFNDGSKVEVTLGSYYDGSQLEVEVPAGVEASVAGRYDECVLTVCHNDADVIAEGNVVVKGPGVKLEIPVKEEFSGIESVGNVAAGVVGVYDLSGNRVDSASRGIYIVKYSDGSVRKSVMK